MKKVNSILYLSVLLVVSTPCFAQQTKDNALDEETPAVAATVKGRIVQNENKKFEIELSELNPVLNQQVQLPQPPIPETWADMTVEQRQTWVKEFEASDKGKVFLEDRKKRIEAAAKLPIQLEDDGNFVVYDVPHGDYGIRGFVEKELDGKKYVLELFGQISIGEKVDEVLLDPMRVAVTRRLSRGEATPEFEALRFDGKSKLTKRLFQHSSVNQKYVLINFWSMKSPPSQEFAQVLQKVYAALGKTNQIQLFSVCIDSDPEETLEYVKEKKLLGWHGYVESWESDTVNEFGVRILPSLCLLSPEQKIAATDADFRTSGALQSEQALVKFIKDTISGKVPEAKPGASTTKAN